MDEKSQRSMWVTLILMGSAIMAHIAWTMLRDDGAGSVEALGGAGAAFVALVGIGLSVRHYLE